ncbi:MAG: hypothetical protein RRY36_04030 [Bacteroidaceae bacterium]
MKKNYLIGVLLTMVSITTYAGGLLTNTNQNIAFLRNPARDASIEIDAVYSNPAGIAFLQKDGFHFSLNGQSAFQTRTITSTFAPFAAFGGNATKEYEGEASAPFVPSLQAAYKKDKWSFSGSFAVTGGGGKATFNKGLGSFESIVAMLPAMLSAGGYKADRYSVNSYMEGKQYIFGLQLGAAYKITDYLSAFAGVRINYVSNSYKGYMRDIKANVDDKNKVDDELVNVSKYFTGLSQQALQAAAALEAAGQTEKAELYRLQAKKAQGVAAKAGDIDLDCSQTGWGVTPIIGADFKMGKWNVGVKYEFNTKLNVQNQTVGNLPDGFDNYKDGVNTPHDIPSLLTVGASYEILPVLRASIGYHHFFDTHAKMADGKQKFLSKGTNEYLGGLEWDVCRWAQVSAGMQRTKYGFTDKFMSDMSFNVSSYSYGFGAGFNLTPDLKLNVAYFFTDYEDYTKVSEKYNGAPLAGTDVFTRTNKVFGIGLDYRF